MNIFKALVMREILDGKNGYIRVPLILAGITIALLILALIGFGNVDISGMDDGIHNLGDGLTRLQAEKPEIIGFAIAAMYWMTELLVWIALPFVVFFSLLGTLYEERRDRSIMFWKSMPTADWQEVLAKLFVPLIVAPLIFLVVTIAAQLLIAIILSVVVLFQSGPVSELWPVGIMFKSWLALPAHYFLSTLWMLPIFAWLLLVSSFASRMPFLWALLPPFLLVAVEGIFLKTWIVGKWLVLHLGAWREALEDRIVGQVRDPADLLDLIVGEALTESAAITFTSVNMWAGLIIAGGFVFAAIEMRKRAI
jgi:ABC-2 type transport system permease protein